MVPSGTEDILPMSAVPGTKILRNMGGELVRLAVGFSAPPVAEQDVGRVDVVLVAVIGVMC